VKKRVNKVHNPNPRALTHDIQCAIRDRILSGLSLVSRHSKYLLIDGYKISKNTYSSWLRRGTIPADAPHAQPLSEVVAKARQRFFFRYQKKQILLNNTNAIWGVLKADESTSISYKITTPSEVIETTVTHEPDVRMIKLKGLDNFSN
jgi:hypothetical protein